MSLDDPLFMFQWFSRKARREHFRERPDYKLIAQLEHEIGMDDCEFPDAPCAKLLRKMPPHLRERSSSGRYWIHLAQCWCNESWDVTSMSDVGTKRVKMFDPEQYKNQAVEWVP